MSLADQLAFNRAWAVVWAQWRSYRNYGKKGWAWLSYLLQAIWYGAWLAAGLAAGVLMARAEAVELTVAIGAVLLLMSLYWQLIPMMMAASGLSLELHKLKIYPIPVSQLFLIEVALRVTAALEMLLILSGAALGLLFNPALSGFRALGVIPFAIFHMLLALGLRDVVVRMLSRKRLREVTALAFVALFTLPRLFLGPRSSVFRWLGRQFNDAEPDTGIPWLPWVATARIFTGNDAWIASAIMLGWCALACAFAVWQFQKTLRHDPEAAQSGGSGTTTSTSVGFFERIYQLPSALLPDPMGVLLEKELRYLLRAARFRMLFLASCAIGLAMAQAFNRGGGGGASWGPSFLTPANAYTLLMLGEVCIWNVFGFDRGAAQMYFVSPVPLARVLMAKNLAAMVGIGLAQVTTTLLCVALRFPVTLQLVADSTAVTVVVAIYLLSAGNYMSVSNARPTDPDSSMRTRSAGSAQMLLLFLYPIVFLPAALAYFARWAFDSNAAFFGVLAVMGAIGLAAYTVAVESTAEYAERRREAIVTALAAGHGPISS